MPKKDHLKTARKNKDKTRWIIKEGEEYSVFKISNERWYYCSENNALYSLVDDCSQVLGENGERIAFYGERSNPSDPWHGYPIFAKKRIPSSKLLDKMVATKFISESTRIRIEKSKL